MKQKLKLAVACMHSEPGDIKGNLRRTESMVAEASERGADWVCFPELSLTGYVLENPERIYDDIPPDALIASVTGMARDYGMLVMAGFAEFSGAPGRPYITQIVAAKSGLLGSHRKTHLAPPEKALYRPGNQIQVFRDRGICFGLQLCYEVHFPEISTVMALKGADLIIMPHASPRGLPEGKIKSWLRHLPGRAFDNGLFVVAFNQVGRTRGGLSFPGVILAISPVGRILEQYGGEHEKLTVLTLDAADLHHVRDHKMRYFLPERRPELYGELLAEGRIPDADGPVHERIPSP